MLGFFRRIIPKEKDGSENKRVKLGIFGCQKSFASGYSTHNFLGCKACMQSEASKKNCGFTNCVCEGKGLLVKSCCESCLRAQKPCATCQAIKDRTKAYFHQARNCHPTLVYLNRGPKAKAAIENSLITLCPTCEVPSRIRRRKRRS